MNASTGIPGSGVQRWYSGKTLICAAILIAAFLGLRPGMHSLAGSMRKVGVPARKPLVEFDVFKLSRFERSATPVVLSGTITELGTEEYGFFTLTEKESPGTAITLGLTYYCSPGDKVPHTPEVCYRHSGYLVKDISSCRIAVNGQPDVSATTVVMAGQDSDIVVVYLFHSNGAFYQTRNQVRWVVLRPGDEHIYFSKIEAANIIPSGSDPLPAIERCRELLGEVIPVLIADHLPRMPSVESE